ncbi:uncharacterized protein N0V89_000491 [Didymosphaeria variabile]|uniref:Microtubule associated protein n=1 Tax=Didymosphaeria variabile TaxID=1932322 RepID=A0A9W8XUD6_9PLEO|nr:uncharacterized protein N0V89_000491 [Didymosphaeria variabile]KAJ4359932.1 hypothetical protein N0V89_000491 [Didymosphaeria variabile]
MVQPTRPPRNGFNAFARKIYNPLGFSKAYNFILWFIFAGALFGFTLARFTYLNFDGIFCPSSGSRGPNAAAPGECYWYRTYDWYKAGIILHLAGILPACILVVVQFTPIIRHKAIIIHRVSGWFAMLLWTVSVVGALMIARRAFNGTLDTQAWVGLVGFGSTICFVLSIWNVKRLQIEQHRAWMLRGWFYAGSIVTNRFILIIATSVISSIDSYYTAWPCAKIAFTMRSDNATLALYPECASFVNGTNPHQQAVVHASFNSGHSTEIGAGLNMCFGMALWVALAMHAIGVEVYLHLTPKEAERLRNVSYQRQLEAGMRKPGSEGLTADRLGDAETWMPQARKRSDSMVAGNDDQPPKIELPTSG